MMAYQNNKWHNHLQNQVNDWASFVLFVWGRWYQFATMNKFQKKVPQFTYRWIVYCFLEDKFAKTFWCIFDITFQKYKNLDKGRPKICSSYHYRKGLVEILLGLWHALSTGHHSCFIAVAVIFGQMSNEKEEESWDQGHMNKFYLPHIKQQLYLHTLEKL